MPHIVADNEETAWYALGYEQARDALYWIQYANKAAKGELFWVRGDTLGIFSDFAVQAFDTHGRIAAMSVAQRESLLASTSGSTTRNFYKNCVAYAAGADAYRQLVQNATQAGTPEFALKTWLDTHGFPSVDPANLAAPHSNLSWVYQHPIEAVDIAAHGAWTAAFQSFWFPGSIVNSFEDSYTDDPAAEQKPVEMAAEPDDPFVPGGAMQSLDRAREMMLSVPGGPSAFLGSNTFAWSGLYCVDPGPPFTTYSGVLGDPHQPTPLREVQYRSAGNHLWYAHIQVTPSGQTQPTLDVLGHFPHGTAAPFTGHNRNVAMGGTLGAPNHWDTFLLRLEENASFMAATPRKFYSYYDDNASNPTNATYAAITSHSVTLKIPPGYPNTSASASVPYWRAESFGVIPPAAGDLLALALHAYAGGTPPTVDLPVVYGERVDPAQPWPRWRVDFPTPPDRMRFWNAPHFDGSGNPLTSPMVVTVRTPIDPFVDGQDMHLQLMRDFWEIAHADTVLGVIDHTNGGAFRANVSFADRAGRTFSTVLSAVPQRGNDVDLAANGYTALEKWAIYQKSYGPVPARHFQDIMFDWQFKPTQPPTPEYLDYADLTAGPALPPGPHKLMTYQDQGVNFAMPPTDWETNPSLPFTIESGFFAAACNDMVWGYSRKRDGQGGLIHGPTAPFNNGTINNQLLQWALDNGVVYQSLVFGFEGPDRNQIVVDRFTKTAERIIRGPQHGLPALTSAEMRGFVVTPALYRDSDYVAPAGVTTDPTLPVAIRQLKEAADHPTFSLPPAGTPPVAYESPIESASREIRFFADFWRALYSGLWSTHNVIGASPAVTVDLKDLWVDGGASGPPGVLDKVFWYDDPVAQTGLRWIDMPHEFPLVDFFWPETEVGRGIGAGSLIGGSISTAELQTLRGYVTELVNWGSADYRMEPASTGATLLQMMRQGYRGTGKAGRHWVRLRRGEVEYSTWVGLTVSGQLPPGGTLVRQSREWSSLQPTAFPFSQHASLFTVGAPTPPYDALYDQNGQVRTTLDPTHTNALVQFFLELGGFYTDPKGNGDNPSRKLARYDLLLGNEADFVERYPVNYPLSNGLRRLTALRALLDAGAYLESINGGSIPPFHTHFRARSYDQDGVQLWPSPLADADCVGSSLRAVAWHEDATAMGFVSGRGYQPRFLGLSGSIATMLAMFPSSRPDVDSYYWCTPGIELMTNDPNRFDDHMAAFASNSLMPTHYDDFTLFPVTYTHTY